VKKLSSKYATVRIGVNRNSPVLHAAQKLD